MKSEKINKLWKEDSSLFNSMIGKYQSENEKRFFDHLHNAQFWDFCVEGELLLSENDNDDRLYIFRGYFDEYDFGQVKENSPETIHTMNLSELLSINLKENGFIVDNITLLQWLQNRDYRGIRYDQNRDYK